MEIQDDEILARIVFSPRNINPVTKEISDSFIYLRKGENDLSFIRFELAGGMQGCIDYGKRIMKKQTVYAVATCIAREIRSLSPIITITADSDNNPFHVSIRFIKDGNFIVGEVSDAQIIYLMDKIKRLLKYHLVG